MRMTIINLNIKVLVKLLNKTQTKFSTSSDAEGDKGFSDISVESLSFRHAPRANC